MEDAIRQMYKKHFEENHYLPGFIVEPDGQIYPLEHLLNRTNIRISTIYLFPGSFNPLHDGHKAIFKNANLYVEDNGEVLEDLPGPKLYEISIERIGKEHLTVEEVIKRVKQFSWHAPVLVTNCATFLEKIGILYPFKPTFAVGFDTATRLLETYKHRGLLGFNAYFKVFPRKINGIIQNMEDAPDNFFVSEIPEDYMHLSSSEIREKSMRDCGESQ